jgi:hypothetical protein
MTAESDEPRHSLSATSYGILAAGVLLIGLGVVALAFLLTRPRPAEMVGASENPGKVPLVAPPSGATDTASAAARIDRGIVAPPTRTPTPTLTPSPTPIPTSTAAPTTTDGPPPEIEWTQEERYALQWLCYGEVGGMTGVKVDACLSVISTVRARYAYTGNYPDLMSAVMAPGQFNVTIHTDQPGPDADLNWAVDQYQTGARGSCNGYPYFNSIPGGPAECTLRSGNGQFLQFHNQPLR